MKNRVLVTLALLCLVISCGKRKTSTGSQAIPKKTTSETTFKTHSDNGDGTYTNPVIAADFPDPDVIRVGDTYYMVSTTMFIFPGVTILNLTIWLTGNMPAMRFNDSILVHATTSKDATDMAMGSGQQACAIIMVNSIYYLSHWMKVGFW